jgi:outer membrane protein with beta-barrel domain
MKSWIATLLTVAGIVSAPAAHAQGAATAPGAVNVTLIPAGATFFTEGTDSGPSFGNYDLGGGVAVNFNRHLGIEGEVTSSVGVSQDLTFSDRASTQKTPNIVNYTGNLVLSLPNHSAVVPYVAGGIGGLTMLERADLGIDDSETFLTGNVGAGLKWFNGNWGIRGDYRFVAVKSRDDAPAFFGQETRYGHRVYAGVLINVGR